MEQPNYDKILKEKTDYYGQTLAAFEFSAIEYAKQMVEFAISNLTEEQRGQIALEEFRKQPIQNICTVAVIKIAEVAISTNAETGSVETEATLNGKRYKIKAVVTYKQIDE